jgi:hypothetical protein
MMQTRVKIDVLPTGISIERTGRSDANCHGDELRFSAIEFVGGISIAETEHYSSRSLSMDGMALSANHSCSPNRITGLITGDRALKESVDNEQQQSLGSHQSLPKWHRIKRGIVKRSRS